ncbi:MAG: hypothetical protein AAGA48_10980 [Myxococcota bacterium]
MWYWALVAGASPPAEDGFAVVRTTDDCRIESRNRDAPGGSAMRATCDWPEVDPQVLGALMADLEQYEDLIFALVESEITERDADRVLVYQRQSIFGLSDREVLLWAKIDRLPPQTIVSWTTASDRPLALRRGAIRTPRNEGFWKIEPGAEGGTRVVHEIGVDAGGRVPEWIVRLVRTRGFLRVMNDIRKRAASESVTEADQ